MRPPSCDPILIGRKIILHVSTEPLAYHWEWSTTTQHLTQSPHHCLPQNRIPKGHPSIFPPSQMNIPIFCSQQTVNNNDWHLNDHYTTLSQPTHTSQLAHSLWQRWLNTRTGAPANLKPTYTSLPSHTSWTSIPCSTHFSSLLHKSGIPNRVVFATNNGRTKPCACIPAPKPHGHTQPIKCNSIPQKDTMIPKHATF